MKKDEEEFSGASMNDKFQEFKELVEDTTANLKRMTELQEEMRWQFNDPQWWIDFEQEITDAVHGWVSSHC